MVDLYGASPGTRLRCRCPTARRRRRVRRAACGATTRASTAPSRSTRRLRAPDRRRAQSTTSRSGSRPAPTRGGAAGAARASPTRARLRRRAARVRRAAARSAPLRCASSTAASRSPTGCRRWRSRSACSASRASFSAQVLARRKEFGLLAHLGLTRAQVLGVVAAEGAVWTAAGALLGLLLGLAVSVVLVKVVNPQSFHWTMDLRVPWARLALLCVAVLAAGTLTGWLAGARARRRADGAGGEGGLVATPSRALWRMPNAVTDAEHARPIPWRSWRAALQCAARARRSARAPRRPPGSAGRCRAIRRRA